MELQYYGGNCLKISTKKASLIIDDTLADLGLSSITKADDIVLFTSVNDGKAKAAKLIIDHPGEYEVSDISVQGIAVRSHMDELGKRSATIFKVIADDIRTVITGHIHPDLTDDELEAIGTVDVLVVPVGGNGYTLDGTGALKVIRKIEPKLIIPTHFNDKKIKYPAPQQDLETALKGLAMEPKETVPRLKLKPADLTETTQLIILERQ